MSSPIQLLLIANDPSSCQQIQEQLVTTQGLFHCHTQDRLDSALDWLARKKAEVVLLDLNLPDSQGGATLTTIRQRFSRLPIVVLIDGEEESLRKDALHQGAQDVLLKEEWTASVIARSLRLAMERKRSEQGQQDSLKLVVGVSHEFNNLLSIILGFSESLLEGKTYSHELIEQIKQAGERGKILTQQLSSFFHRQNLPSQAMDGNTLLSEAKKFLQKMPHEKPAEATPSPKTETGRADSHPTQPLPGSETVFVVEEDEDMRRYMGMALQSYGFQIREAQDGESAIKMCKEKSLRADLLITDVHMSFLSGPKLYEKLKNLIPGLQVVFLSGFTLSGQSSLLPSALAKNLLVKPFTPIQLVQKVRGLLQVRSGTG